VSSKDELQDLVDRMKEIITDHFHHNKETAVNSLAKLAGSVSIIQAKIDNGDLD